MSRILRIHPLNPQSRLLQQAAQVLREGGVIVYPTDSSYALACAPGEKSALDRIRRLRGTDLDHEFTLVCRDLSEISTFAKVDNAAYRMLKSLTPGPYTFVLKATSEAPKRLRDPKKKTIGIRVPDNPVSRDLLDEFGSPILSSTLVLAGDDMPMTDPDEILGRVGRQVELVIDGGACGIEPTTVLDLSGGRVEILRKGKGSVESFER
jgi:tRNA threonylcarbamoyl adenosine modification protein (Sua5/YciO/YrdC/YwlC family)